jgi:hypothetical protein
MVAMADRIILAAERGDLPGRGWVVDLAHHRRGAGLSHDRRGGDGQRLHAWLHAGAFDARAGPGAGRGNVIVDVLSFGSHALHFAGALSFGAENSKSSPPGRGLPATFITGCSRATGPSQKCAKVCGRTVHAHFPHTPRTLLWAVLLCRLVCATEASSQIITHPCVLNRKGRVTLTESLSRSGEQRK